MPDIRSGQLRSLTFVEPSGKYKWKAKSHGRTTRIETDGVEQSAYQFGRVVNSGTEQTPCHPAKFNPGIKRRDRNIGEEHGCDCHRRDIEGGPNHWLAVQLSQMRGFNLQGRQVEENVQVPQADDPVKKLKRQLDDVQGGDDRLTDIDDQLDNFSGLNTIK